jgi:hypothetical protein
MSMIRGFGFGVKTEYNLALMPGESVIYNGEPDAERVIARQRCGVWRIEADGENVVEVSRFECDGVHPVNGAETFLTIESFDKPGKWRVLLERVEAGEK